jgi:hypothetical protein
MALVGIGAKPELLLNLGHRVAGADKIGVAVTKVAVQQGTTRAANREIVEDPSRIGPDRDQASGLSAVQRAAGVSAISRPKATHAPSRVWSKARAANGTWAQGPCLMATTCRSRAAGVRRR